MSATIYHKTRLARCRAQHLYTIDPHTGADGGLAGAISVT